MKYCNPMVVGCESNYTSATELPYCSQNANAKAEIRRDCAYFDAPELLIGLSSGHFLPTKLSMFKQTPSCKPSAKNKWSCPRKYAFDGKSLAAGKKAPPEKDVFVADIEHFTLLIDHAYHRDGGGMSNDDFMMQGYFKDCRGIKKGERECVRRPIVCVHDKCQDYMVTPDEAEPVPEEAMLLTQTSPRTLKHLNSSHLAPPAFMRGSLLHSSGAMKIGGGKPKHSPNALHDFEVVSIQHGDVLSVNNLIDLAGIESLDEPRFKGTYRTMGMTLMVHIHYSNLAHWHLYAPPNPPTYEIDVSVRPTYEFQYRTISPGLASPDGNDRTLYNFNGISIQVEQTGELAIFDVTTLIVILTTSLGLLAVAGTLTDFLAFSVLPEKEEYAKEKYKYSKDFSSEE